LIAQIVRQLNVQGPLAPFEIGDVAVPVFDIGQLAALDVPTRVGTPAAQYLVGGHEASEDTEWFFDDTLNAAGGTVLADTGQLAAGVHVIHAAFSGDDVTQVYDAAFEWRDAANAVTLTQIRQFLSVEIHNGPIIGPLFVNVALNERFRWVAGTAIVGTVSTWVSTAPTTPSIA